MESCCSLAACATCLGVHRIISWVAVIRLVSFFILTFAFVDASRAQSQQPAAVDFSIVGEEPPPPTGPPLYRELWEAHREALQKQEEDQATEALNKLLRAKEEHDWPDFSAYADALAMRAKREQNSDEALRLAATAQLLGPHTPGVYLTRAELQWQSGGYWEAAKSWLRAVWITWREAPPSHMRWGNSMLGLLIALLVAACGYSLLALYRYTRLFGHTLRHLLPAGPSTLQLGLLTTAIMVTPLLFRVGPAAVALIWLGLLSPYYKRHERLGAIVVLSILLLMPIGFPFVAKSFAYPASDAHQLYRALRSLDADDTRVREMAKTEKNAEAMYVIGMRELWHDRWEVAKRWLIRASEAGMNDPELFTTLGNMYAKLGENREAISLYNRAIEADDSHVEAHFNLSRVYYNEAEHQKAGAAHRAAMAIDYLQVEYYGKEAKRIGTDYVAPVAIPDRLLHMPVDDSALLSAIETELWEWLGAAISRTQFMTLALVVLLLVVAMNWSGRLFRLPVACKRCGHAACKRCDPDIPNVENCGDCYRAFGAVDASDKQLRIRKEIDAHRHAARAVQVRVTASLLLAGAGHIYKGKIAPGLLLMVVYVWAILTILVAFGLTPMAHPMDGATRYIMLVVGALVAMLSYSYGIWAGIREES